MIGATSIVRRLRVRRRSIRALIAKRHRNRMQILQRQSGNQQQQHENFQKTLHAVILIVLDQA